MSGATNGGNPHQCGTCGAAIPSTRQSTNCPKCYAKLPEKVVSALRENAETRPGRGSAETCIGLGMIALCVGMYFLINPSANGYSSIANMHALALGQTFTVTGAVLLGFGIRPR